MYDPLIILLGESIIYSKKENGVLEDYYLYVNNGKIGNKINS